MMFALPLVLLLQAVPAETPADPPIDWDAEFGVETPERDPVTGEIPVDPHPVDNANAGARPFTGDRMARAFGGQAGIRTITDRLVALSATDPRTGAIFAAHDGVRLRRLLFEQLCYILNAGCNYTGRDMANTHRAMGLQSDDLNALVENLQLAMRESHVPFAAQNRLLAKLAPMHRDVVTR